MKKILPALFFLSALPLAAQVSPTWGNDVLDINSVRAGVNSNGDLFWNYINPQFQVPADSMTTTIIAGALWIGGLDTMNQLHLAAQTYRQTGNDFFNGPVMNSANYSTANDIAWAHVWKINKSTIDTFLMHFVNPALFPGYTIPASIMNWPGNGDVNQGQAPQLAPFVDMNSDGYYDPNAGDYPCIKGDQSIFFIFNDDRSNHTETGGAKFGIELHGMLYGYKAPGTWLDSVVFVNYRLFNRTANDYNNLYLGSWADFDIGFAGDDYIGCDVARNIYYGYNGDADDGSGPAPTTYTYGANPPAQGVVFLRGPEPSLNDGIDNDHDGQTDEANELCAFNRFIYYNNDFSATGNPATSWDYYKYMSGRWKDSSLVTYGGNGYGGTTPAAFMFPGNTDPAGIGTNYTPQPAWDEYTAGNSPGDRRGLGVSGPFPLPAHKEMCIDFAYVFGRGLNGPLSSVAVMQNNSDSAVAFYNTTTPCLCVPNPLAVHEYHSITPQVYPNPSDGNVTVFWQPQTPGAKLELYDMTGNVVLAMTINHAQTEISMEDLATGIYLLRITDGNKSGTAKIIKE